MKLIKVPDATIIKMARGNAKTFLEPPTNKDIIQSVINTCKQYHSDCEHCPYWLKRKFNCIWNAHRIIGDDVMAYWDENEIEEIPV